MTAPLVHPMGAVEVTDRCTACGACLATCPTGALLPAPRRPWVKWERCTLCLECIEVCPRDAIAIVDRAIVDRAVVDTGVIDTAFFDWTIEKATVTTIEESRR